jgi:plasmid stabilization system protein ParE
MAEEKIKTAADRIVELGAELEAPGHAALTNDSVEKARAVLHQWVDQVKAVVVNPALGRVSVIHENGYASSIASADLAFLMSSAGITRSG